MRLYWLMSALGLALVLVLSERYIVAHDLFWSIRWLDTPMHVLGGLAIGTFIAALTGRRPRAYWFVIGTLFIGWEVFEYMAGLPQPHESYALDTIHDLANDVIGGGFIYALAKKTLWRSA